MQDGHLLHEIEPESGAFLAGIGALQGEKLFKYPLFGKLGNTRPLIGNAQVTD